MSFIVDSQIVQTLLLIVIFLSILVEVKTGGTGIGALLGMVAAAVFWGSGYVHGLVSFYEIAMFIVGVIFIIVEILTPTIGIFAGVGIAAVLYSLILAMGGDINAMYMMAGALIVSVVIFALIIKKLPTSRLWNKLVLKNASTANEGYVSSLDNTIYLHKEGTALTELRPSGTADIEGSPVDVISEGSFIAKGSKIRVVKVEGVRIIVRRI